MKKTIERKIGRSKFLYEMSGMSVVGSSKYTLRLLPVKIEVLCGNKTLVLKQTAWLLKLINSLPLLNIETFTPLRFYENGIYCGIAKKKMFQPVFDIRINSSIYEIRQHNNNYISLMRDNIQIALYKKELQTIAEHNKYIVEFDESADKLLILLFAILADTVFYSNEGRFSYCKYEKDIIINDKFKERTNYKTDGRDI